MALTTKQNRPERHRDEPRVEHRREMAEGLVLLAALVLLAIAARLPAG